MDAATDVVRRFWESVWSQGNTDELADLLDPNWLENGERVEVEEFQRAVAGLRRVFPDFTATVEELIPVGSGLVVSRVTYRGTQKLPWAGLPATGRSFATVGIDIFTIRDRRIVELWHSTDHLDMAVQLGARLAPKE